MLWHATPQRLPSTRRGEDWRLTQTACSGSAAVLHIELKAHQHSRWLSGFCLLLFLIGWFAIHSTTAWIFDTCSQLTRRAAIICARTHTHGCINALMTHWCTRCTHTGLFPLCSNSTSSPLSLIHTRLTARCCHGDPNLLPKGAGSFRRLWTQLRTTAVLFFPPLSVCQGAASSAAGVHNYPLWSREWFHSIQLNLAHFNANQCPLLCIHL